MIKPIAITCFLLFFTRLSAQSILFVNHAATGQQTGTSWSDALTNLRDALTLAQYGDQIWIAQGTYYPTTTTDRAISFQLKNGVSLYGGFDGSETSLDGRNPTVNLTRLSGNIGDTMITTDNSLHVLRGSGLAENTIIDGFIISDGNSINQFTLESDSYGAGLYLIGSSEFQNSRPVISNCIFENNSAGTAGGAMYIGVVDLEDPSQSQNLINPYIENCIFRNNFAKLYAGALMKEGPTGNIDTFSIKNCLFLNNQVQAYDGGALYITKSVQSNVLIYKCHFESNETGFGSGGGISIPTSAPGHYITTIIIESCSFKANVAGEGGGFTIDSRVFNEPNITLIIRVFNCKFEKNISKNDYGSAFLVSHTKNGVIDAVVRNCDFLENRANGYFTAAILSADECTLDAVVENCLFHGNQNTFTPSNYCAAFSAGGGKKINTHINNCVFTENGNAIFAGSGEFGQVTTTITNCTFFRNGTQPFGKRWYPSFQQAGAMYYNNMHFKNCVIWEDLGNPSYMFNNNYPNNNNAFGFRMDYCSINISNPNVVANSNLVFGDSMIKGIYPMFLDTSNLDFRLDKCSVAINQGFNTAAADAGILTDLDGLPRVRFDTVDLGAYEQQISCIVSTATNPTLMQALLVSPNPGTGELLSFQLPASAPASGHLRIYAANGAVVQEQTLSLERINQVSLPKLPPGCYNVLLSTGKTAFVGKWVVVD